jgi:chromosome partitioning protein
MPKNKKIIAIIQQKGGTGKTTMAAHISTILAQSGKNIAMLDIDPQASLTAWHSRREKSLKSTNLKLYTKAGWRLQNELNLLEDFDYIIIDSPPHSASDTKTALREADVVLIPMQPSPPDLLATEATIDFCQKHEIRFNIVLNRVVPNSKLLSNIARDLPNLLPTTIGNRVAFANAMMTGKCVTETEPSSQASHEMRALVGAIIRLL